MDELLLLSGNDIPYNSAQVIIHQPTLKEIAMIGEEAFFTACELLNFSKEMLSDEDKNNLKDINDFDILIAILEEQNAVMQKNRNCVLMLLTLIFPNYKVSLEDKEIKLVKDNEIYSINKNNYEEFRSIIKKIFDYKQNSVADFNPSGDLSKKIADKLKKRHEKLAKKNNQSIKKIDVLSRCISVLAVGESKDMNSLLDLTVYQLFDEFKRFGLKESYDLYIKAKLAGAQDLKEVEDWKEDIHS